MITCLKGYVTLWYVGGETKCFICHMTSTNRLVKGSCNFMIRNSSLYVTTLPSLVTIGFVIVEMYLVCYVIQQDHVTEGSCDYLDGSPSR